MDKKQFDELMKSVKAIEDKLEILLNIHKATMPKPSIGKEERKGERFSNSVTRSI